MKVRVTLMTENDKHMPFANKEEAERVCRQAWNQFCETVNSVSGEKSTVEYVEVIEN